MLKAHRLLFHSTLNSRVIQKKIKKWPSAHITAVDRWEHQS